MAEFSVTDDRPPPATAAYAAMVEELLKQHPEMDQGRAQVTAAMHVLSMALFVDMADPSDPEAIRARVAREVEATLLPTMSKMAEQVAAWARQKGRPC